jgi:hypothetical protein
MIETHRAYLQSKKRLYAPQLCDSHCHHSYWYQHAGWIITMNIENRYENRASRTTVNTQIGENECLR